MRSENASDKRSVDNYVTVNEDNDVASNMCGRRAKTIKRSQGGDEMIQSHMSHIELSRGVPN